MNPSANTDPTPQRTAPQALWRIAAAFMATLHALFGAPEDLAADGVLTRKPYLLLLSWLRCGEAMMRRLLLIEAHAYAKPNTPPLLRPARKRARKPMSFTADAPHKWRVSFRCFSSPARGGSVDPGPKPGETKGDIAEPVFIFREDRKPPERGKPSKTHATRKLRARRAPILRQDRLWVQHHEPSRLHNAWPLAERYEALLRVFNNPAPYALRLSRRLHATPHRAVELTRAPPEAAHRIERFGDFIIAPAEKPPRRDSS